MNLLHMKYALEVARLGSLSKAAEALHTAQPNVSRSIKELESDLGVTLFNRSQKGMLLTPEGEDFIGYAREILRRLDEVEALYKKGTPKKQRFSVSVPRACYISAAIADLSIAMADAPMEILYRETNTRQTLDGVLDGDYQLGILRYAAAYDAYFKSMLEEKGLAYEMVAEFSYTLLMSRNHPLAGCSSVTVQDLAPYIEVAHADPYTPTLAVSKSNQEERPISERRIFVFERASQFDLLSKNTETYMWVSPIASDVTEARDLITKPCADNHRVYKDVLIWREGHALTRADKAFITALIDARRRHISS